jgi:ornithine--oxo-acid transaminase
MRAGLTVLDVLQDEKLGARGAQAGEYLRRHLTESLAGYEMVGEIRGLGLLNAIEFKPPQSLKLRVSVEAVNKIHPALFGQILVMRMFRDHHILNQICGNNFMTLKIAPPLIVENERLDRYVTALRQVVELMHTSTTFWTEALGIARRVVTSL